MSEIPEKVSRALDLLDQHYGDFFGLVEVASETGHPVPMDTRGWSQILVSLLTGLKGLERKKGADLEDGSDVKAANTWEAIDTPRFNGVIKAGTKSATSDQMAYLDSVPYLFLVLWDHGSQDNARCRIWCVRPQDDPVFRQVCSDWYDARATGKISSTNFQLHPPRGLDTDQIRNSFGSLDYPLFFCAIHKEGRYELERYDPSVLTSGLCSAAGESDAAEVIADSEDSADLLSGLSPGSD